MNLEQHLSYDKGKGYFLRGGKVITVSDNDRELMHRLNWWQAIPFAPDCTSPGYFRCAELSFKYYLDQVILEGRSVLGIGCYEGFQLFMAEALGASRVVGICDDFNFSMDLEPSRVLASKILGSKVEWINRKFIYTDLPLIGQFDVVFLFDVLPHLRNPYHAIEKVESIAQTIIFCASPIIPGAESEPTCHILPQTLPQDSGRNYSGVTSTWIKKSFESIGFGYGVATVLDEGYFTGYFVRTPELRGVPNRSLEELPLDTGDESRTAVVVMTCKKYEQVWEPFFTLFSRYWPDCPYRIYMGTDCGNYPGVETIELGSDQHWASNTLAVLEKIDADRVILFQEDFLLTAPVDTSYVRKLVHHSREQSIASLRLYWHPPPTAQYNGVDFLGVIGPFDEFRVTFQLTIWDKSFYCSILKPGEDPWTTEFRASQRSILKEGLFLGLMPKSKIPIPYLDYAIDKGEWSEEAFKLLQREGIDTSKLTKRLR